MLLCFYILLSLFVKNFGHTDFSIFTPLTATIDKEYKDIILTIKLTRVIQLPHHPSPQISSCQSQNPTIHRQESQTARPQPQIPRLSFKFQKISLPQPQRLRNDPPQQCQPSHRWPPGKHRAGEVHREEDKIPEEVLGRANLVERDKGKCLSKHCRE